MAQRLRENGFSLVEVVIAAGLLAAFLVPTVRPVLQLRRSSTIAADRAVAAAFAQAGLEYARSLPPSSFDSGTLRSVQGQVDPFEVNGVTFTRHIRVFPMTVGTTSNLLFRVDSYVEWSRYGRSFTYSGANRAVKMVSYVARGLAGR